MRRLFRTRDDPTPPILTHEYAPALRSGGKIERVDIVSLDAESLLDWLHNKGECNVRAENLIGVLFGHGPLHRQR